MFVLMQIKYFLAIYFHSLVALIIEFYCSCERKLLNKKLFDTTKIYEDLSSCVCLIVGASNGDIGKKIIRKLAKSKCFLIITLHGHQEYREKTKIMLINNELNGINPSSYRFEYLDLTSFQSIVELVKKFNVTSQKINFFIFNPGVALKEMTISDDNFDIHLQINYLSGCLLLIGIFPLLVKTAKFSKKKKEPKSKIIFTSSSSHKMIRCDLDQINIANENFKKKFNTHKMYPSTKLFQLMFNLEYFERMIRRNELNSIISFINVHPGIIDSGLYNNSIFKSKYFFIYYVLTLIMKTPEIGATNVTAPILSYDEFFNSTNCLYLEDLKICPMNQACYDKELRNQLYKCTLHFLRLKIDELDLPRHFNPLIKF